MAVVLFTGAQAFGISLGDSGAAVNIYSIYSDLDHGEYLFRATSGPVNNSSYSALTRDIGQAGSFQSFCLGYSRDVDSPVNYVVNDEAIDGGHNTHGPAGNQGGDTLSVGTAWLYSQFATGVLASYAFTGPAATRIDDARELQHAFWALEDELADSGNLYLGLAITQFGSLAAAQANYTTGQYGVYALNNKEPGTNRDRQDMLY